MGHAFKTRIGPNNPAWKGGRFIHRRGYAYTRAPWHPFANASGYVYEHRLVMEDHLNRYLWPWEVVHHINEELADNRAENLEVLEAVQHTLNHYKQKRKNSPEYQKIKRLHLRGLDVDTIARIMGMSSKAIGDRIGTMKKHGEM
jgi:hypothetical protein